METGGHTHVSLPLDRASPFRTSSCRLWLVEFKLSVLCEVFCVWNVLWHAQTPYLVLQRTGRVHLNRRGSQFSRLLAAEECGSSG